ncbi:MAG: hypothetical protein JO015_15460 [Verrucomicrobia bacterium]|nr:hypothetical protein [Verrucomicrobiota bacterium]
MVKTIPLEPIDKTKEDVNPAPQARTLPGWPASVPVESQPLEDEPPPPPVSGRTLGLWLDGEDCAILSKMVVSARAQGLEASEAQILRALLRVGLQHPGAFDQVRALLKQNEREGQAPQAGDRQENPVRTAPSGSGAA